MTKQREERPKITHVYRFMVLLAIVINTLMPPSVAAAEPSAAAAGGSLLVEFLEYRNPTGHDFGGHCCDGKYGFCQSNGCDYIFDICLDLPLQPRRPRSVGYSLELKS